MDNTIVCCSQSTIKGCSDRPTYGVICGKHASLLVRIGTFHKCLASNYLFLLVLHQGFKSLAEARLSAFSDDVIVSFIFKQLSAAQEQHRGLCSILQGASVTLHTILWGVGGSTIYNNHTLVPSKELGPEYQRAKKACFQASCAFCQLPLCQYRAIRGAGLLVPIIIIIKWTSCGIVLTR